MSTSTKPVVVVTGASRGLGLEFVTQLLQDKHGLPNVPTGAIVIAAVRDVEKASALKQLKEEYKDRLDIVTNDVSDEKSNANLATYVQETYGRTDLLILNAGIAPLDNISTFKRDVAIETLTVNAFGPIEQTKYFLPILKATEQLKTENGTKVDKSSPAVKILYVSSTMGSITSLDNSWLPTYRASKSALNMYAKAVAIDNPQIAVLILSPGWVATDLGKAGGGQPPLDAPTSISNILQRINELTLDKSGQQLVDYDGKISPW